MPHGRYGHCLDSHPQSYIDHPVRSFAFKSRAVGRLRGACIAEGDEAATRTDPLMPCLFRYYRDAADCCEMDDARVHLQDARAGVELC